MLNEPRHRRKDIRHGHPGSESGDQQLIQFGSTGHAPDGAKITRRLERRLVVALSLCQRKSECLRLKIRYRNLLKNHSTRKLNGDCEAGEEAGQGRPQAAR